MLIPIQNGNGNKLSKLIQSPIALALGLGMFTSEAVFAFTSSNRLRYAALVTVGFLIWFLFQNRRETLDGHKTEVLNLKEELKHERNALRKLEIEHSAYRSRAHNKNTYTAAVCESDIVLFQSLLDEPHLSENMKELIRDRIQMNRLTVRFVRDEITSKELVERLFSEKDSPK